MRKFFIGTGDRISNILRRYCMALSPGGRLITILVLCVVFGGLNFYIIFSAIYEMGQEEAERELKIEHIKSLELERAVPDSSYNHLNIKDNETKSE